MLELKNISFKKNGKLILEDINLIIDDNSFIVITGPNGSGKSTLAKIIMGIEKPTTGSVIYNNKDITNLKVNERANLGISFSFQTPVTFKGLTVYDLLSSAGKKKLTKKEACNALSKVGLCALEYIQREVDKTLSGGELKRIEIASVLCRNSRLYIFDEPESGIDLWSFNRLTNIFNELKQKEGVTTIIVSHQERILSLADKIIVLNNGRVEKEDTEFLDVIKPCCKMKGVIYE